MHNVLYPTVNFVGQIDGVGADGQKALHNQNDFARGVDVFRHPLDMGKKGLSSRQIGLSCHVIGRFDRPSPRLAHLQHSTLPVHDDVARNHSISHYSVGNFVSARCEALRCR